MKNYKKNLTAFIFIMLSSIAVSLPLIKFNIQYDDGIQHVVRLIETARELKEGTTIFPVIMQNLCNGFGYSWNLFYSPLTAYTPLIFRLFGFSFENCLRIFMFFLSILSGYAMYFFLKKILKNKDMKQNSKEFISILGATFYIFAPYRLNDMYIRVAIAELTSFVFIPIIFNGLYSIVNLNEKKYILAFGTIGIILSHTLISFYTAIFCIVYILVNINWHDFKSNKDMILIIIKNIVVALLITSFYLIPLLESKLITNYEVFNSSHMIIEKVLLDAKVKFNELFFIEDNRMAYFIGLPVIFGIILTFIMIKNNKIENKKSYYFFLISGILSVILTLSFIPFERFPMIFKMMQFSFRMLEFSTFFLTTIACINIGICIKKFNLPILIIFVLAMFDLIIPITKNINFDKSYIDESRLIQGIPVKENTGRIHAGCASFEYLPNKAFENKNYIATREDIPIAISGDNVEISDYKKDRLNLTFKAKGTGIIELPYIYYIGYTVKVDGKSIQTTESENGFVQISINSDKLCSVEVSYTGSIAMKTSAIISLGSVIISLLLYVIKKFKVLKNQLFTTRIEKE